MNRKIIVGFLFFFMATFTFACNGDDDDNDPTRKLSPKELWERAETNDTAEAYEAYLTAYPSGSRAEEAERRLRQIWAQRVENFSASDMKQLRAVIETEYGTIKFKFIPDEAPNTCRNFIKLAESHFYDGLTFFRAIDDFIIQTGCPFNTGKGNPGYTIDAELSSRMHKAGTVAMARLPDELHSAGSQFYICLTPQPQLDNDYTVFGELVEGMKVAQTIGDLETDDQDKPLDPPVIKKVYIEGL